MAEAEDALDRELAAVDGRAWVRSFDPQRSAGGFNLVLHRRRVPAIFDLNGRLVHSWPQVRASGRVRLDDEGRLTVIGVDRRIKEYDWEGRLLWSFALPGEEDLPHHDLIRLQSGALLVLANDRQARSDYLLEVQRDGSVSWRWNSADHRRAFASWDERRANATHANAVHELPPNRWHAAGDQRFRPGNLLVSARNLSTVFVIDRNSGQVVWQHAEGLDHQHEASMIPVGEPGAGAILLFDNGLANRHRYRRSRLLALNPQTHRVVWHYASPYFFSSVEGTVQALPGGNLAVTSSRGGRAFEIDREGEIVWEWAPSYPPIRTERLRPDHCPQLAAVEPAPAVVVAAPARPFIDRELSQYAVSGETTREQIAGAPRKLLRESEGCRSLRIPPDASLRIGYGIRAGGGEAGVVGGRFRLELRERMAKSLLVDSILSAEGEAWSGLRPIPLGRYAYREIELCLSAQLTAGDDGVRHRLVWGNPIISSRSLQSDRTEPPDRLSADERQLRTRQLEALGYIE